MCGSLEDILKLVLMRYRLRCTPNATPEPQCSGARGETKPPSGGSDGNPGQFSPYRPIILIVSTG